jgi:hypothetical protein
MWQVSTRSLSRSETGEGRDTRQLTIYVNTQSAFQQQQDTLLHEILHAVISNCPVFHDSTTEESLIRSVTPYLLTVLKDNPGVVEFMTSEVEPEEL